MRKEHEYLQQLLKAAPEMQLSSAMAFATEAASYYILEARLQHVLAILSESVIGLDSNGHFNYLEEERPCVQWAIREVIHVQAGIACNPFDSMEKYLDHMDSECSKEEC